MIGSIIGSIILICVLGFILHSIYEHDKICQDSNCSTKQWIWKKEFWKGSHNDDH
jgi:hypothetical protein